MDVDGNQGAEWLGARCRAVDQILWEYHLQKPRRHGKRMAIDVERQEGLVEGKMVILEAEVLLDHHIAAIDRAHKRDCKGMCR